MYQYCPQCTKLIEDTQICPYCGSALENKPQTNKITQKEAIMYITSLLILVFAAFYGRDLSSRQQLTEGMVILIGFTLMTILWYYLRGRSGIGYPIK